MEKSSKTPDSAGRLLPEIGTDEGLSSETQTRDALPSIELKDARTWWFYRNGDDDEMIAIVSAAEHWARSMQKLVSEGSSLEEVWMRTFESSYEDATEHSLWLAVRVLSRSWCHGEILRELYDKHVSTVDLSSNNLFED